MFMSAGQPVGSRGRDLLNDAVDLEAEALNLFVPSWQRLLYCTDADRQTDIITRE